MRCGLVVFGSVFATQPILDSTCQSHRCSAYGKGVVDLVGCPMDKRITLLLRVAHHNTTSRQVVMNEPKTVVRTSTNFD